jgi:hypothetical protein
MPPLGELPEPNGSLNVLQKSYRRVTVEPMWSFVDGSPGAPLRRGLLTLQAWSTKPSCKSGNVGLSLVVAVIAAIRVSCHMKILKING